jgi:hypothetical protein
MLDAGCWRQQPGECGRTAKEHLRTGTVPEGNERVLGNLWPKISSTNSPKYSEGCVPFSYDAKGHFATYSALFSGVLKAVYMPTSIKLRRSSEGLIFKKQAILR